jgi:hypothetical protein
VFVNTGRTFGHPGPRGPSRPVRTCIRPDPGDAGPAASLGTGLHPGRAAGAGRRPPSRPGASRTASAPPGAAPAAEIRRLRPAARSGSWRASSVPCCSRSWCGSRPVGASTRGVAGPEHGHRTAPWLVTDSGAHGTRCGGHGWIVLSTLTVALLIRLVPARGIRRSTGLGTAVLSRCSSSGGPAAADRRHSRYSRWAVVPQRAHSLGPSGGGGAARAAPVVPPRRRLAVAGVAVVVVVGLTRIALGFTGSRTCWPTGSSAPAGCS